MNRKRVLSIGIAMILALGLMSGCGKKADEGDNVRIKWLTTGDGGAKAIKSGDRIIDKINERLGIKLQVQVVPQGNVEKVNVAMASGDMPDIVTGEYGTSATQKWIDKKMVIPLNDYFKDNPDIKKRNEGTYSWSAIDGKFYGVPFTPGYNIANGLIVTRQDWLDKLNLKYPTTLDEMKNMLIAFKQKDPDGNGKADTLGYTTTKPNNGSTGFEWVFYAFGRKYADYCLDKNKNAIPVFEDDSFIPAMKYIKELWDAGVVDKEIFLNDTPKVEEKFYQGKVGAIQAAMFRHVSRIENNLRKISPKATLAYGLAPKGPNGDYGNSAQGKGGMITCITSKCKHPDKAAAFMNFMISDEGTKLVRLGIEGIHYTMEGDKIIYNMKEREKDSFADNGWSHPLAWGSFFWPLESNYIPDTEPSKDRALETVKLATQCKKPNLIKQKTPLEIRNGQALNDIYIQYFSDMIQGRISIENGAAQLSKKWRDQGGEDLIKEINQFYKKQSK